MLKPDKFQLNAGFGDVLGSNDPSVGVVTNTATLYAVWFRSPQKRYRVYDRLIVGYDDPDIATMGVEVWTETPPYGPKDRIAYSFINSATANIFPMIGGFVRSGAEPAFNGAYRLFCDKDERLVVAFAAAALAAGQKFQIRGTLFESDNLDEIMACYR